LGPSIYGSFWRTGTNIYSTTGDEFVLGPYDGSNVSGTSISANGFAVSATGTYRISSQATIVTQDTPYAPFFLYLKVSGTVDSNQSTFINQGDLPSSGYGMISLNANVFLIPTDRVELFMNTTINSGTVYVVSPPSTPPTPNIPAFRTVVSRIGS
jgi:hypothetical protein